jgi:hypothetical protein
VAMPVGGWGNMKRNSWRIHRGFIMLVLIWRH